MILPRLVSIYRITEVGLKKKRSLQDIGPTVFLTHQANRIRHDSRNNSCTLPCSRLLTFCPFWVYRRDRYPNRDVSPGLMNPYIRTPFLSSQTGCVLAFTIYQIQTSSAAAPADAAPAAAVLTRVVSVGGKGKNVLKTVLVLTVIAILCVATFGVFVLTCFVFARPQLSVPIY